MKRDKWITFAVTSDERDSFNDAAKQTGTSVSEACRGALKRMVKRADKKQAVGGERPGDNAYRKGD